MTYQTQSNAYMAYKVQSAKGSQASGGSAKVFREAGGAPGIMTKAAVENPEVRRDGMSSRGRHGTQKTQGTPRGPLALGAYDDIFEALMRDTYSAADDAITEADMTSITTGANTIVAASGSWLDQGVRVGDIYRLTSHSSAGNNDRNIRVSGVTASTITTPETLTVNAVADTSFTLTRTGRKLIQNSAGSLVKRYFTIEEHELDLDSSELFDDCVFGSGKWTMQSNGIIMFETGWWGTGKFDTVSAGSAPHFTSPTENTATAMAVVDATIRLGSEDLVELTGFELGFDLAPNVPDTFGSGAQKYGADVFGGNAKMNLNITALRKDLAYVANYVDEDQLSLHVLAVELESEPKSFISLYVPNFTFGQVNKSALQNAGGPRTQTLQIPPALVGKDERGGAYDATMLKIQVSNAS